MLVTVRSSMDSSGQSAVFFFVHHPSPGLLQALIVQQEATQVGEGDGGGLPFCTRSKLKFFIIFFIVNPLLDLLS